MDTDSEKSWLVFKRFLRKRESEKMREFEKVEVIENERKGIRMVRVIENDHDREKLENIEKRKTMRLTLKAEDVKLREFNRAV